MNRFNLSFKGVILGGRDPERTKLRVAELLGIEDPVQLEKCFSGEPVVLRGNLDRKTAAEYFSKLKKIGLEVELVTTTAAEAAADVIASPSSAHRDTAPEIEETEAEESVAPPQSVDEDGQSWAVSSARGKRTPEKKPAKTEAENRGGQSWAVSSRISGKPDPVEQERRAAEQAAILAAEQVAEQERQEQRNAAAIDRRKAETQAVREERQRKRAAHQQALREKLERETAEEKRRQEEEAARQQAEAEKKTRRAREEERRWQQAARKKSIAEKKARKTAERKQRREEEAAGRQAIAEEKARKAAEEKRRREEEAARQKAIAEEKARKAAEEKRRREEEAARQKAIAEEKARKAAEEKRRREEEAARRKAIAEEKRRREEEAARQQQILEEQERKATEEAARRKAAQEAARREAERVEQQHLQAEAARERAAQEAAALKAAEEAARREAELVRKKREQAEEQARRAAEQAALLSEAGEEAKRKAALAEEQAREAERLRIEAVRAEHEAQRTAMEEKAVSRAAQELSSQPSLKPVAAKVRTRLEVPKSRAITPAAPGKGAAVSHRQPGVPNLYSLRPFRNTPEIQARAESSAKAARRGLTIAALALAFLLITGAAYLGLPADRDLQGARAMAIDPGSGPLLLAGDTLLLHDRAGVGTDSLQLQDLGLVELGRPMLFDSSGVLLALGRLAGAGDSGAGPRQLLRCQLQDRLCEAFSTTTDTSTVASAIEHPLTGNLFLADRDKGQVLHISAAGELLAQADAPIPEHPVLQLASGLLFINSINGPAISVLRYDEGALGQQLDEILLLPPPAMDAGQSRVWDFIRSADHWWVTLFNPETDGAGVYRFDDEWNFTGAVELAQGFWPEQLGSWGPKTLILDSRHIALQRYNAQGVPEVPLVSDLLQTLVGDHAGQTRMRELAWRSGLAALALALLWGLGLGWLHRTRSLVYRSHREHGAEPVDDLADQVQWIAPVADRGARLRRNGAIYAALSLAGLAIAIGLGVSVTQLSALLLALSGPAIALLLFSRSPAGHIGILPGRLLLADHNEVYHLGGGARLQYRGAFLLIDDVVVFTGSGLFPAFPPERISAVVEPLARAGIKVDRKSVFIKLLQGGHPLARGAVACVATLLLAAALLSLGQ